MENMVLNRDVFLQIKDELYGQRDKYVEIVPGLKARIVQLTADAGFGLVALAQKDGADKDDKPSGKELGLNSYRWICACVLDVDGNSVFQMDDLKDLPFELVQRLARAVNEVNGLSAPDSVEEAEKN